MVRLPKNIRQIGTGGGDVKIYVEDYVETWLHQYAEDALTGCAAAVFVGERIKTGTENLIFLYGAVKADCILDGKIQFTESVWTEIYQEIKKYFPDGEIMGWFLGGPSFLLEADTVRKVHADHFSGANKVLMKYDALEREEAFYLSASGGLAKQEGYYIYYDRNEGMQSYMVDHKRAERSVEADFPDHTTKKIRAAVAESKARAEREKEEKEKPAGNRLGRLIAGAEPNADSATGADALKTDALKKPDRPVKGMKGLMYAAGTLAAAVMLIIGASMLNRYENAKKDPDSVSVLAGQKGNGQTSEAGTEKDGSRPGTEQGTDTGSKLQTGSEAQTEAQSGAQTEKPPQAQSEDRTQPENQSQAQSENPSEGQPENPSEEQPETAPQTDPAPETQPTAVNSEGTAQGQGKEEGGSAQKEPGNGKENGSDGSAETSGTPAELKYYTVEKGDTLLGIALRLYHSADYIQKIKELNEIKDENLIYIGQTLIIP